MCCTYCTLVGCGNSVVKGISSWRLLVQIPPHLGYYIVNQCHTALSQFHTNCIQYVLFNNLYSVPFLQFLRTHKNQLVTLTCINAVRLKLWLHSENLSKDLQHFCCCLTWFCSRFTTICNLFPSVAVVRGSSSNLCLSQQQHSQCVPLLWKATTAHIASYLYTVYHRRLCRSNDYAIMPSLTLTMTTQVTSIKGSNFSVWRG